MTIDIKAEVILPADRCARLLGRVWSEAAGGPCPVLLANGKLRDLSSLGATVSAILNRDEDIPADVSAFPVLGALEDFLQGGKAGRLLSPNDLQVVKAAGVTFVDSMLERVIDERSGGDATRAEMLRGDLHAAIGDRLENLVPGSPAAARVKEILQNLGYWSQYLEVGIGPEAEIFTKAPPMATVGCGADVGINRISQWNNPEPEVVLAVNARGEIKGAALGNDVNLRDVEGRSALLLGKAKDNNGSCAIGPFIRLFDDSFGMEDVEQMAVRLSVTGEDGFKLESVNDMTRISRRPTDLVAQAINASHQYPDGFMLFLGTMFAPVKDRGDKGMGFTHKVGDVVTIHSEELGALVNRVDYSDAIAKWSFGLMDLFRNLAGRRLL